MEEAEENLSTKATKESKTVAVADDSITVRNNHGGGSSTSGDSNLRVSLFDFSVENFFHDMETIAKLCGEEERNANVEQSEIKRMSSSVTFLRAWRDFKYPSKNIRFTYGLGSSECYERNNIEDINLPQFSSAAVHKYDTEKEELFGDAESQDSRDFVMNVGGSVWALDWCPRMHGESDCSIKCEFIAVAAHPPGSSYHKMGAPLSGRGAVQIWCLLSIKEHNKEVSSLPGKKGKKPKKDTGTNDKSTEIKNPTEKNEEILPITNKRKRGRPKKNPAPNENLENNEEMHPITNKRIKGISEKNPAPNENLENNEEMHPITYKRRKGRSKKNPTVIDIPSGTVQFEENSIESPAPDGYNVNNEETLCVKYKSKKGPRENKTLKTKSAPIKRPRGRPKQNSKEVTASDPNCENQFVSLASEFPDSAEFISQDVVHGNSDENHSQQFSNTKEKNAKKVASACDSETPAPNGYNVNNEETHCITYKSKKGPRGNKTLKTKSAPIKRPRGRPKQNSKEVTASDPNCENQFVSLASEFPDSAEFISQDVVHGNSDENHSQQFSNTKEKNAKKVASACDSETPVTRSRLDINHMERSYSQDASRPLLNQCVKEEDHQSHGSSVLEPQASTYPIPQNVALPKFVSCLAHNGKVAWDVKWRPLNNFDSSCNHRMGYLAVLLGNGSLEVWEVPLPHAVRAIYTHIESTDPRFLRLEPVFKCSMLKRGSLQSIPLTVEWSVTPPHDYLLAGCHDGTVALWKFSTNSSSKCDDTRPILCFGGDTVPIRTVAWAPFEGDPESSNIVVTAGHEGLKFWDLRNPFRPLRLLNPSQRIIYSLVWLSKPSCIIMCFEDGAMKTISLAKTANDLPVTGTIYNGKRQPGLHGSIYSSYAIWSVQVSPITGMVAYCGADGAAFRYQLTAKAVEAEHPRNRTPFFLCGSVSEEESTIIVNTQISSSPFPMKKVQDRGHQAQSFRDLLSKANLSRSANNQMIKASGNDSQFLALCDGDSPEQQPKRPKLSCSRKKKPHESTSFISRDGNTPGVDNEKLDSGNIPEVFPSKKTALHKVRWNLNKGSERWLCFGGANGLVRCQEIVFNDIDKKRALKRW
ncbi:unnamed protein product [Lathyrus sativus]|nr:unnamed protein product [Lathyrus sativus]